MGLFGGALSSKCSNRSSILDCDKGRITPIRFMGIKRLGIAFCFTFHHVYKVELWP